MNRKTDKESMIIIVGAGLAGLSAAYKLIHSGYKDLKIIEAKHRAGGRVESLYYNDGSRIDLGAQWLHGERENPIYSWLKDMDCIESPEDEGIEFEGLFRVQSGHEPSSEVVAEVLKILMDVKSILCKKSSNLDTNCRPIDIYKKHIELETKKRSILKSTDPNLINSIVRWFELHEMIDNSCEDMSLLSTRAYSHWTDFDDGKMVRLKGGWQNVVNKLIQFIGEDKIYFGCPVEQIDHSNPKRIEVKCSNNSFYCDHVLITFSVGVMRDLKFNFFNPSLSIEKRTRLNKLGFDVTNKIFLQFEQPYLQKEKGLKLLWSDTTELGELPSWTRYITGFDLVSGAPNFLLSWIGGKGARDMEHYNETDIGAACLQIFRLFVPDKQPPKLVSVSRSTWATDPYIKGAYSYLSIDSQGQNMDDLWDPVCIHDPDSKRIIPRILFAGEATAEDMYSTAHGAIISGWREANRLMKL